MTGHQAIALVDPRCPSYPDRVAPVKKPATLADLAALPEHVVGEIINGELVVSPRPRLRHGLAETRIATQLGARLGGGGGDGSWLFIVEPELHLGDDVLVPDVAGWRTARAPTELDAVGVAIAPDWVCEVLSPSTAKIDRAWKAPIFARRGVGHLWLVDPVERLLEVYRRHDQTWLLAGLYTDDARARIEPFGEVEVDLSAWWPPRPPGSVAEPPVMWTSAGG